MEMDLGAFLKTLESAEKEELPFHELMATALFHAAALMKGSEFVRRVAGELEVAPMTVARYASGASCPLKGVRKSFMKTAHNVLSALKEEFTEEHRRTHLAFRRMSFATQATEEKD